MSKYTPEQLQSMARQFLAAYEAKDPRWVLVIERLKQRGYLPEHSFANIQQLAGGE
jgi:hypothetical protein